MESIDQSDNWITAWGADFELVNCENCDTAYLLPQKQSIKTCPHCGTGTLSILDKNADQPIYTHPPEQIVPITVHAEKVNKDLHAFVRSIWLKPDDLKMKRLHNRLQEVYLPLWLVDADVQAKWQAEVGFDYEVVSHREQYKNGGWQTQRIRETKIRWEPRLGTLTRHYANKVGPALEEHNAYAKKLGRFRTEVAEPYQAKTTGKAFIRLPNRSPEDAWSTAQHELRTTAIAECKDASSADHIREFKWKAGFQNQHWTQMLLPIYSTYYLDDDKNAQMLFIHGQTGQLFGSKRASMKKAKKYGLALFIMAIIVGVLSFLALLGGFYLAEGLLTLASIGFMTAVFIGILALIPIFMALYINHVSYINTTQELRKSET